MNFCGCTPCSKYDYQKQNSNQIDKIGQAFETIDDLKKNNNYLTSDELNNLLGKPDLQIMIKDLPGLLSKDRPNDLDYSNKVMQNLYDSYMSDMGYGGAYNDWKESEKFKGIFVWLYKYENPNEIIICGGIPFPSMKRTGIFSTYSFFIEESKVVAKGILKRKLQK